MEKRELKDFVFLVERHSDDAATRRAGGDMGWVRRDATNQWNETLLQTLFALREPGDVSPVVSTSNGFYIVRLNRHRPASIAQWAEVRERIRYQLAEMKETERANQFFASLKAGLRIQINRALVEAVKQQLKTNPPLAGAEVRIP
jgi:parvulin-like peptidyl-prolyl isomerase